MSMQDKEKSTYLMRAERQSAETLGGKLKSAGCSGKPQKYKKRRGKIMKHFLEHHKFYVVNDAENLVYEVGKFETYEDADFISIELELVAGWDYINPDENDIQGYVPADRFIEDIQYEYINQYFLKEGTEEALQENGYTVLKNITPDLQKIIDKHNEFQEENLCIMKLMYH